MNSMNWFRTKFYHSCITLTNVMKSNKAVGKLNYGEANFGDLAKYAATSLHETCKVCTDSNKSKNQRAVPPPPSPGKKGPMWRNISLFVAFPAVIFIATTVILAHMREEHHEKQPYVGYEYMYRRTKRFPWGKGEKSFFHNPKINNLPSDKPEPPPPEDEKKK